MNITETRAEIEGKIPRDKARVLLLGPPGTGKTTSLVASLCADLEAGIPPDRIGYVSFTKSAVLEARKRAIEAVGGKYGAGDFVWFRTLHSVAYKLAGVAHDSVMKGVNLCQFARQFGTYINLKALSEGGNTLESEEVCEGNELLHIDEYARIRRMSLHDAMIHLGALDANPHKVQRFSEEFRAWKVKEFLTDFTDMLELSLLVQQFPSLDVLYVDEAQDLSTIQWEMIWRFIRDNPGMRVVVAGDDDQSIYEWGGADVAHFLSLVDKHQFFPVVLDVSYRIGRAVHAFSVSLLERLSNRYEKSYRYESHESTVQSARSVEHLDLTRGEWLVLGRSNAVLKRAETVCRELGVFYRIHDGAGVLLNGGWAIRTYANLQHGHSVSGEAVKNMLTFMQTGGAVIPDAGVSRRMRREIRNTVMYAKFALREFGYAAPLNLPWASALALIAEKDIAYLEQCVRNNEKRDKVRIQLTTIHKAKGQERDNVAVFSDVSPAAYAAIDREEDAETRVFYVASTRARKALHLIAPETEYSFSWPTPTEC